MSNNILFVFEGEKTEVHLHESFNKYFVNESTVITCAYCNNIYELYDEIEADQDLDTFELLKGIPVNFGTLNAFHSTDFAEIYLFFDYDCHANKGNDDSLEKVLSFFSEETDKGKMYISYPMVESIRHYPIDVDFKELTVAIMDISDYKKIVHDTTQNKYQDFTNYTRDIWIQLLLDHILKMNFIVNRNSDFPEDLISQENVFSAQIQNYKNRNDEIAVLSSIPAFFLDYYGLKTVRGILY